MTRDGWYYFLHRRTVRCSLLGKAQQTTKHVVNTTAGLCMPRRPRMQETCKSQFSLRPNVPADQLPQLCGEEFLNIGNGTLTLPLCLSLGTNCFESAFQHKGGWTVRYKTAKHNHSTGPFNVHFLLPKVLLFRRALRECLPQRFNISLLSLPYMGKKINEEGTNLHSRCMKSPATSSQTSTRWIQAARTSLLV